MKGIRIEHAPGRPKPYLLVTTVEEAGKRSRRKVGFASLAEAERAKANAERLASRHGMIAVEWNAEAFREWKEARELIGDASVRLSEVVLFWKTHAKRDCPDISIAEAVEAFLADKRGHGLSKSHVEGMATRLGWLAAKLPCRAVSTITAGDIVEWVKHEGGKPRTQKNNKDAAVSFMNYAERKGWTDKAPDIHESDLPKVRRGAKAINTPEEMAKVFAALKAPQYRRFVAWFALQAFAGIRRAEAGRMKWEFFDFQNGRIVVPAHVCKTGDDWVMEGLQENLWAWLSEAKDLPIRAPANDTRAHIAGAAGVALGKNTFRHSFCTYHLSLNRSAEKTALLLRHRNTAQLWRSYFAGLKTEEEAAAYFAIMP